jgi:hypothetical protein
LGKIWKRGWDKGRKMWNKNKDKRQIKGKLKIKKVKYMQKKIKNIKANRCLRTNCWHIAGKKQEQISEGEGVGNTRFLDPCCPLPTVKSKSWLNFLLEPYSLSANVLSQFFTAFLSHFSQFCSLTPMLHSVRDSPGICDERTWENPFISCCG